MSKSTGGKAAYKGLNAQAWAAMSLFLQFVGRSDFQYIGFEGEKLEDFNLVFNDGRRLICESKNQDLNYSDIRNILDRIHNHGQIAPEDKIIIICKGVNKNAKSDIENYTYFKEKVDKKLKADPHKYKEFHLKLIPQVRFWEVPQDMNERIVRILVARLLGIWVPEKRLEEMKDNLVLQEVYHGSAEGKTLTKDDFLKKLEEKKIQIFEYSGYEIERQTAENDVRELLQFIEGQSDTNIIPSKVSDISRNPSEFYFFIMKLKEKDNLNLSDWDIVWHAAVSGFLSIHLFDIFKKNLQSEDNQQYSITFAEKVLEGSYDFFHQEFVKKDIADLCKLIFEKNSKFEISVFEVIKKLFKPSITDFFYTERPKSGRDDKYEREEVSKLVVSLYQVTKSKELKDKIIKYLSETFNLVEDHGQYWHYTPTDIFTVFREEVINAQNLEGKIIWFKDLCLTHYDNFHGRFNKKWRFDGWELMGGGISQMGSVFSISDNHFVTIILKPALLKLYQEKENGWNFIIKNCISRNIEDVSRKKPDFLNRASMPVLFAEYKKGKHSSEAFDILSDFIRMRKGIPWKADLIFQEIRGDYTLEQKWALVKVSLDEYNNLPVNVFVEQIVSDLAEQNHRESVDTIANWVMNPEYHKRQTIGSYNVMGNISKLLDNLETFNKGVTIYKNYIASDEFIKKDDDWQTWEVAKVLAKIIVQDPDIGVNILKEVNSSKTLTLNQQILICSSLNNLPKDNKEVLQRIYKDFVYPFLKDLADISKIEERITNRYSREQIVQFAEKLAEIKLFDEALYIINIFINDSDPILNNYPDDPEGNFNRHQKIINGEDDLSIGSVRGYCAWVLQKFATLYGRSHISAILPLVEKLTKDQNYYVRLQACIPLLELAKNRNTVLPENRKERFITVELAQKVEDIAFRMLRDKENHKLPAVMKHLAMVFTYMRSISQKKAYEVLQTFLKDKYPKKEKHRGHGSYLTDILDEAAPLYIFFAEYRLKSFNDWPKDWGGLGKFDDKLFKKLLINLVKSDNPEIRQIFSWQVARLPNEVKDTPKFESTIKLAVHYLGYMTATYDHGAFENIYRFIEDYIDEYFDLCFGLWKKCIETESQYFKDKYTKDKLQDMYWWPFFYNGKILIKIAQVKGTQEFLNWLKLLVDYPIDLLIANDLDITVEYLTSIKTHKEQVEKLFSRLIERNPKYYEYKQKWLKNETL